jgi:hypothetical protein
MPDGVPKVAELGVTSAPLKSAAFFLGSFCKEFTGPSSAFFLADESVRAAGSEAGGRARERA